MKIVFQRLIILFGMIGFISVVTSTAQSSTYIASIESNPSNSVLAFGGVYNGQHSVWLTDQTGQVINQFSSTLGIQAVSLRPDGNMVAGYGSGEFTIWDSMTGSIVAYFSQQGATQDPMIHWNPANFSEIATIEGDLVHIRDANTGQILQTLDGVGGKPDSNLSIGWSQDGTTIFTVSTDNIIRIWDVGSSTVMSTIVFDYGASSFALSPDKTMLAVGGGDGQIRVYDTTGTLLPSYSNLSTPSAENSLHVVWSWDSTEVTSVVQSGIQTWDVDTGQIINILPHLHPFWSSIAIAFNSDNALIYPDDSGNIVFAPVALAGSNQTLSDNDGNGFESLVLDGSGSSDSDGTIVSYEWLENDVVIATGVNPQATFDGGVHEIILRVTDNVGATGSDLVTITVEAPATGGGPDQILFSSVTDPFTAATNIFVINPDGTGQTQLTTGSSIKNFPAWSPDGSQILYTSNQDGDDEIFVMNADGSNPIQLTSNTALDRFPVWSPDGSQIAFASYRDGNWEIYVMNADGSNPVNLTNNAADDFNVSWSPDGSQIAFASLRDGTSSLDTEINVMNADGTNVQRLTNSPSIDETPNWSPDGTQIAFTSDRSAGNIDIYTMNADGTNVQRITTYSGTDEFPNWSPDGTQIAFDSNRSSLFNLYFDIHTMNADGTNVQRITTNGAFDRFAAWGYP